MLVEWRPIGKVKPFPNNPRVIRNAAEKVAESIREFGWQQPIVVDQDGVIIIGHSRLAAAKLLKQKEVPVHVAADLSPGQARALRIADNKTATFANWDDGKLADELAEIMRGVGSVAITAFSSAEYDALILKTMAEIERIGSDEADERGVNSIHTQDGEQPPPEDLTTDDAGNADGPGDAEQATGPENLVPFNVLMTVSDRKVLYEAVAKAKERHGLSTTAEAMLIIAQGFIDD